MAIIHQVFSTTPNTSLPVVVNKYKEPFDIYIGRGSIWGNPFTIQEHGRDKCIELYRTYIINRIASEPLLAQQLESLRGKRLGCFCKPQRCHGDILVELLSQKS